MSSRRESRDSEPKRDRSRFDRDSSPKRSRRDEKPEAEGVLLSKKDIDVSTETDKKKPRQSLRDAAPLEPDSQGLRKEDDKKHSGHHEMSQGFRSRPYHQQHDDRRTTGKDDRRPTSERGSWRGSRDQSNRRAGDDRRDQDNKSTWRHDRFHETDDTKGPLLSRKRPAFREKKIPDESRNDTDRTRTEEAKDTNLNSRRQNERSWRSNLHSDRHERPTTGRDRAWNRDDGSRQSYRSDREGFNRNGRSGGFHGSWTKAEKKWDHDLYEEANKSPARANEEEQIAKVEALLSS